MVAIVVERAQASSASQRPTGDGFQCNPCPGGDLLLDGAAPLSRPIFAVTASTLGTTRTVAVTGEIDLGVAAEFDATLQSAIRERPERLIVDLSALEFIDSSGVHALLRAHRHASAVGVSMMIVPAPGPVNDVFRLCGLDGVLTFMQRT
jgi:anti-sigma B factor antagonist